MTPFVFVPATFRATYLEFSNATIYTDDYLTGYWDIAITYMSASNYGYLNGDARFLALNLLTAHLIKLTLIVQNSNYNQIPGMVQAATIDRITVTLTSPPVQSQWQWWLSLTQYGQQLLALLQVNSVGGWFLGGSLDRATFRNAGGYF